MLLSMWFRWWKKNLNITGARVISISHQSTECMSTVQRSRRSGGKVISSSSVVVTALGI